MNRLQNFNFPDEHILENSVLTVEQQTKLKPADVLKILKEGNRAFADDKSRIRKNMDSVKNASFVQNPKAAIVSCLDTCIPVEDIFQRGPGDFFVTRVTGNIINKDILDSLEYACKVSGAKLIMVLGHEYCQAITSAIKGIKQGNVSTLFSKIKPAVINTNRYFKGTQSIQNINYLTAVCYENVRLGIRAIRQKSPLLRKMEKNGEIIITGGIYDMELAEVDFLT